MAQLLATALPETIATGRVYRLGGVLALDGTMSWAPTSVRGAQPANCYLILGRQGAVLIDTGVRVHERQIIDQLASLLPPGLPLSVLLTRTEMDCCLNLPAIEAEFPVETVYFTGGITVPRASAQAQRLSVPDGGEVTHQVSPDTVFTLFAPRLRLLPTLWLHDPQSGVLFTSDSFAHARNTPGATGAVTDPAEAANAEDVRSQFMTKHAWITQADSTSVTADLRRILTDRDVRALAPTHGRPFLGEAAVRRQVDLLIQLVEGAGK